MKRDLLEYLREWKQRSNRKPLVIRGARQVGKTYLVREFAAAEYDNLVELNFDQTPDKAQLFASRDMNQVLQLLELDLDVAITPGRTLLFLDEIQNAPQLIPVLRYFYEEMPDLHVIAAGSLLEFALREPSFSMPVGRIEYAFMGPMSFKEFLGAAGKQRLVEFLENYQFGNPMPEPIHEKFMRLLKAYCVIGGMPAVVKEYVADRNANLAAMEQRTILQTYRDDFVKYGDKVNARRLGNVYNQIPHLVGRKLKYVHIDRHERAKDLADCIDMLQMARVIHCVTHSAGNGVPLGAEANFKDKKPLFLDVGLLSCALGLRAVNLQTADDITVVNNGVVAEQFAGQHLLYQHEAYIEPELHYWNREARNSSSEVDYLYAHGPQVVPVEVKAGKAGSLKSLQVFAAEKGTPFAVRFNADVPSCCTLTSSIASKRSGPFDLVSLPLYLISEMPRLLNSREP